MEAGLECSCCSLSDGNPTVGDMERPSRSIDYWRRFFRSASSDIFEVVEQAIVVAATDRPEEFRGRRDRIAEKFYTTLLRRCDDYVEPRGVEREEGRGSVRRNGEKEIKVDSSIDDLECSNPAVLSNYTYDEEVEALTGGTEEEEGQKLGEISRGDMEEEEGQNVGESFRGHIEGEEEESHIREILRIKEILHNKDKESDDVLLESLRTLQRMEITVDILKATEIGKVVNGMRKYNKSKQISHVARTMVKGWKVLVDEWINANASVTTDNSPDTKHTSHRVNDEGRLSSLPLDGDETKKRSTNLVDEQKVGNEAKAKPQRKPLAVIQDGSINADESSIKARLEISKRKLHEGYQLAENAKKQRTIKIIELSAIPKKVYSKQSTLKVKIPLKLRRSNE